MIHSFIQKDLVHPIYLRLLNLSKIEDDIHQQYDKIFSEFIIKKGRKYDSIVRQNSQKIIDTKVFYSFLGKHLNIIQIKQSICKNIYGFLIQTANRRELCIKRHDRHDILLLQLPSELQGTIIDFELVQNTDSLTSSCIFILLAQNHLRPDLLINVPIPTPPLFSVLLKTDVVYPMNIREYEVLLREVDDSYFLDMTSSKTSNLVIIHHQSKMTSEITVLSYTGTSVRNYKLLAREESKKVFAQHGGNNYYVIVKNMSKLTFQLYRISSESLLPLHELKWDCIWTFKNTTFIEDFDVFEFGVILYGMEEGEPAILKISLPSSDNNPKSENILIPLREQHPHLPLRFAVQPGINRNFHAKKFDFSLSCPYLPRIAFSCSLDDALQTQVSCFNLGCSDENNRFDMRSMRVRSHDAMDVPLTLVYNRETFSDKLPNKTLVSAYGAYGKCLPLHYRPFYHQLLEMGWVLAFAHVRGGGEMGLGWHNDGLKLNKKKSFLDFLAVSNHLIEKGLTSSAKLCAEGESAGGLVIGYAVNDSPQLFSGIILRNAFLNISHEVKDPSSLLRTHEVDEWGNAEDSQIYEYIQSYCPYHDIRSQTYPATYIRYGILDNIVDPKLNSVLWAEKLIENQRTDMAINPVIVRNGNYDHYGSLSVEEQCYESAIEIAFLESCVNRITK